MDVDSDTTRGKHTAISCLYQAIASRNEGVYCYSVVSGANQLWIGDHDVAPKDFEGMTDSVVTLALPLNQHQHY